MESSNQTDEDVDDNEKLHQIIDRMLQKHGIESQRHEPYNALAFGGPLTRRSALEVSRPNEHDTKGEFLTEYEAVNDAQELCKKLVDALFAESGEDDRKPALERLGKIINKKMKEHAPTKDLHLSQALVQRMIADVGGYTSTLLAVLALRAGLLDRLQELEQQRDKFWNVPYRAPDYYARAMALRLAKLYAQQTKQLPTYGTSGTTGEPSTDYTRALKETFDLLGISGNPRTYGEWAVGQLTENDTNSPSNALLASMLTKVDLPPSEEEVLRRMSAKSHEKGADG